MWQRYNQATHIFEISSNNGASWAPMPLNASILAEGAIGRAVLPSQIAYEDEPNSYTSFQSFKTQIEISTAGPGLYIRDTAGPADGKLWRIESPAGSQFLRIAAVNDANSAYQGVIDIGRNSNISAGALTAASYVIRQDYPHIIMHSNVDPANAKMMRIENWGTEFRIGTFADDWATLQAYPFRMNRAGQVTITGGIGDYSRSTPMGNWTAYSGSWAGFSPTSVYRCGYFLVGKTLFLSYYMAGTKVGGAGLVFTVTLPAGFTSVDYVSSPLNYYMSSVGIGVGMLYCGPGGGTMNFYRDVAASSSWADGNSMIISGQIAVQVP